MPRPVSPHNLRQRLARLTAEVIDFGSTLAERGEPRTPQARRHRTTLLRCIRERTRAIDELVRRPVTTPVRNGRA